MTRTPLLSTDVGTASRRRAAGSGADMCRDILSEAHRPGTALPVTVHIRPELCLQVLPQGVSSRSSIPLPLMIDDEIPAAPGYEIHRAPPTARRPQ